jgi:two-component system chemotaxis response regulator CheY
VAALNISRVRFLIIEDNPFMRTLLKQIVRALGVTDVMDASDGAEGFKLLKEFVPDMVLLDWEMEPMGGLEFAKLVRTGEDSPNKFIPMIMITAHSDISRVVQARDAGINELMVKPVAVAPLFNRIRAVVERPRMFVESKDYFGPDRRRRADPTYTGEERRAGGKQQPALVSAPAA